MRLRIVLVLVVAASLAGLWWIGREDPRPDRRREFVEAPDPPPAAPPLPEEPEWVEHEEPKPEGVPKDPVEAGTCALLLEILDAETNEPVRTEVVLWRLDAPGNEHWTEGDQIQAQKLAAHGLVRFDDLPPGNYRAVCSRRRTEGEDSRVIFVQGELTEETLVVYMPRKFRVYLKVFGVDGDPVTRGTVKRLGKSRLMANRIPDWRRPRRLRSNPSGAFGIGGGASARFPRVAWETTATERGFFLGELEENQHQWRVVYRFALEVEDHSTVMARIEGDFDGETTYLGVVVPIEPIRERILLPDGKRADKAGASLAIWTQALRDDGTPPMDRLRRESIRVSAKLAGYRPLQLEDVPLVGPRQTRYLTPADRQG